MSYKFLAKRNTHSKHSITNY